jgi:GTP-binding protein LepA
MELCQTRRGVQTGMDYLSEDRVEIRYTLPLAEIVFDFFDALKSRTKGYASLDYDEAGEQVADLVKVDILLHGEPVDAFSAIVHPTPPTPTAWRWQEEAQGADPAPAVRGAHPGRHRLARHRPRDIRAMRKDVLAKCYGGDISRKRKLLEKQKEGKKRMKMVGRVEVPQEAVRRRAVHRRSPWVGTGRSPSKRRRSTEVRRIGTSPCPRASAMNLLRLALKPSREASVRGSF